MDRPLIAKTYSLDRHQGRALWHLNALLVFKALSVETNGRFWLMEVCADTEFEMPLHIHDAQDEVLYVLEGEIASFIATEELVHETGAFIYIPRGTAHTLRVKSGTARWLTLGIAGGFDQWFFETGEPAQSLSLPTRARPGPWNLEATLKVYATHVAGTSSVPLHSESFLTKKGENIMSATASALPILPGKTEEWKRVVAEATGKRRAELDDMHERLNIRTARWFLQPTPNGDVGIVYLEGDGADTAFAQWGMSKQPFDMWFRDAIGATYGIDFSVPPAGPAPMMMYEFKA